MRGPTYRGDRPCSDVSHIRLGPGEEAYPSAEEIQETADRIIAVVTSQRESQMVRAKFKMTGYRSSQYTRQIDKAKPYNEPGNTEMVEMRTLELTPVYANNDPNHENSKFWDSSPSGKLELGTINPQAWKLFELGKEYYIDFTLAD
jgi:hypothetical protein